MCFALWTPFFSRRSILLRTLLLGEGALLAHMGWDGRSLGTATLIEEASYYFLLSHSIIVVPIIVVQEEVYRGQYMFRFVMNVLFNRFILDFLLIYQPINIHVTQIFKKMVFSRSTHKYMMIQKGETHSKC
ncbi:hypothetical protein ACJX0J_040010 [Zea mays]